jgi:hypothetical protein
VSFFDFCLKVETTGSGVAEGLKAHHLPYLHRLVSHSRENGNSDHLPRSCRPYSKQMAASYIQADNCGTNKGHSTSESVAKVGPRVLGQSEFSTAELQAMSN